MLIGPPNPVRAVAMLRTVESGTPAGNRAASRGSATLHGVAHWCVTGSGLLMITGGKVVSCGAVFVECKWRSAVMVATGSSCRMVTISVPGTEPREVTLTQLTVVPAP